MSRRSSGNARTPGHERESSQSAVGNSTVDNESDTCYSDGVLGSID